MLAAAVRAELRLAVHEFRSTERRRLFTPVLRFGDLAGDHLAWPVDDALEARDLGLRTDLAVALVQRSLDLSSQPAAWLTRVGVPEPHDLDLAWVPVLRRAFEILDLSPRTVAVVTKTGWRDPVHDDGASWARLRIRSRSTS